MSKWTRLAVNGGVGVVFGVGDQLVQNLDEKRALEARALPAADPGHLAADAKMPIMKEIGTYVNYGLPLLNVLAVAMDWLPEDWQPALTTATFQLASRKATHRFSTGATSKTPAAAYTEFHRRTAERASELAAARAGAAERAKVSYEITDAEQVLT